MSRNDSARITLFRYDGGAVRYNGQNHIGKTLAEMERWAYDKGAIFVTIQPFGSPTYTKRLRR